MSLIDHMTKMSSALVASKKEATGLSTKLAGLEKRAQAEAFLLQMMEDPRSPSALRPTSVADFMSKRAAIEEQDLEVAKLAARLYGGQDFGIGDPDRPDELSPMPYNESRADAEFTEWLSSFGTE
jgi:hypothetical protein